MLLQEQDDQPKIVYKNKEIPLSQFIDACSKHYNKCEQFESEVKTL